MAAPSARPELARAERKLLFYTSSEKRNANIITLCGPLRRAKHERGRGRVKRDIGALRVATSKYPRSRCPLG